MIDELHDRDDYTRELAANIARKSLIHVMDGSQVLRFLQMTRVRFVSTLTIKVSPETKSAPLETDTPQLKQLSRNDKPHQ